MNPYAKYLGSRDPFEVIAATPERLQELLQQLGREAAEIPPAPGKWSVRHILAHLADTELAHGFRLRQALAEPHHVIQPFDQERWSASYGALDAQTALEAFTAIRRWNTILIGTVPPANFSKPLTHPERGPMTFRVLIETMAGHDLNHLGQIESIVLKNTHDTPGL